jgi:hypothetical protein
VKSRTYLDFISLQLAFENILSIFEEKLKRDNPSLEYFAYDSDDLNKFIDEVYDINLIRY